MRSSTNRYPIFIQKLLKMLQDQQCQQYIHWLPTQNGFNITNVSGFTQNALAAYFKHQNYSSFVRQLNMYGFTKVRSRDADNIYEHRNFKRGSKNNIKKIQRKSGLDSNLHSYQLVAYVSNQYKKNNELQKLKKSQTELQKKCTNLLQRNRQLLQKNEKIATAIKIQQQKKRQLFQQIFQIMNSFNFQNQLSQQQLLSIQLSQQQLLSIQLLKSQKQNKATQQSKQKFIGSKQNLQNLQNIVEDKQNPINLLDDNQKFLSLDDFINIDYDQMSEGFKFQDQNY